MRGFLVPCKRRDCIDFALVRRTSLNGLPSVLYRRSTLGPRQYFRVYRVLTLIIIATLLPIGCGKKPPAQLSANDIQEFHAAVQDGDATIVDRLLRAKPALVNAKNAAGETPLAVAKRQTESDVADTIHKHGGRE